MTRREALESKVPYWTGTDVLNLRRRVAHLADRSIPGPSMVLRPRLLQRWELDLVEKLAAPGDLVLGR